MPEQSVPDAVAQNPACGTCGSETRYDGDIFICEGCQLIFDADTLEASFLDPEADTCGHPCDNYWHGDNKIGAGMGFQCRPCQLPTGHDSLHWTGCRAVALTGADRA